MFELLALVFGDDDTSMQVKTFDAGTKASGLLRREHALGVKCSELQGALLRCGLACGGVCKRGRVASGEWVGGVVVLLVAFFNKT
ncbi:MAG: hypothetical protein IPK60_25645 [Sandaracinaceae bacterium]|nr:hypothetical protein [Sandaracinaceae bacterium]